jgi:hypothetical protein
MTLYVIGSFFPALAARDRVNVPLILKVQALWFFSGQNT